MASIHLADSGGNPWPRGPGPSRYPVSANSAQLCLGGRK